MFHRAVEIVIRYDLWNEPFTMNFSLDGVAADARTIPNADERQVTLCKLRLPRWFAINGAVVMQTHTMATEILLNRWIASACG